MKQRRHHFVWQHYLSPWCQRGQITCRRNGATFTASTVKIAVEKDFYKIHDLTPGDLAFLLLFVKQFPEHMRPTQLGWIRMFAAPSAFQAAFAGVSAEADKVLDELTFNTEEQFHTKIENEALPLLAALRAGDASFFVDSRSFQTFMFFLSLQSVRTQQVRDRLKLGLGQLKFPPGLSDVSPERIAGVLRLMVATSVTTHYIMQRDHCRLTLLQAATETEFITGDQPVVNVFGGVADDFAPPKQLRFFYPVSPTRAVLVGDQRDDPMPEVQSLSRIEVGRYNALIAATAQHELYGTSASILRAVEAGTP